MAVRIMRGGFDAVFQSTTSKGGHRRAGNADLAAAVLMVHDQSLALNAPGDESFADYASVEPRRFDDSAGVLKVVAEQFQYPVTRVRFEPGSA